MATMDCINLIKLKLPEIKNDLVKVASSNSFNYRNFGTAIEPYLSNILISILKEGRIIENISNYHVANNKNEFPDLTILLGSEKLAIEYKTGCYKKFQRNELINSENSNNDLGTINMWQKKINDFGGENIYFLFVEYDLTCDLSVVVEKVKFDPFYKFLSKNSNGVLRYREKDGNLRPKNFNAEPEIKNLDMFLNLFPKTKAIRSRRIILKHFKEMSQTERDQIIIEIEKLYKKK